MPSPRQDAEKEIIADALFHNGDWTESLQIYQALAKDGLVDPADDWILASDYICLLSLGAGPGEAERFIENLPESVYQNRSYLQASNHYRRMGNEAGEVAISLRRIRSGKWTTFGDFDHLGQILERNLSPRELLDTLKQLDREFQNMPVVQWHLLKAELKLDLNEDAALRAQMLLKRKAIGQYGFSNEKDYRAWLQKIAGAPSPWLKANEIRAIPEHYHMYLQPVGEIDLELLDAAADMASRFFGTRIIIRPAIPEPTQRDVYTNDLSGYVGQTLLRYLASARKPPEDAINQLFVVNRRFLVYGRGQVRDLYRMGLGTVISTDLLQSHISDEGERTRRLAAMIIRHFKYYVERSQGISFDDAPNNKPCVNTQFYFSQDPKFAYCPECVANYRNASWDQIHAFVQALPMKIAFQPDYGSRPKIRQSTIDNIKSYVDEVQAAMKGIEEAATGH
ncbi:hypothetical protein [Coraliomargarita parva]|uniref:hypothetical protein n=1 Tax=Coraliomargarita parva TaxID=3014050 RepID=UPI0022B4FA16|nr:hypothetical protein [Coraliomargarita parva]